MILKNRRYLKLILSLSLGLSYQSCSNEEGTQEQIEISQDEESAEITEDSADAEGIAQESSQEEPVAYDEGAVATEGSELDKSLDDVLDDTLGPADTQNHASADDYATSEEADSGMSIPSWEETPAQNNVVPAASKSPVVQAAHDRSATKSTWSATAGDGSTFAYIVQPGDTLGIISKKVFGDSGRWQDISSSSQLQNPHLIFPGDELQVPVDASSQAFMSNLQNQPKKEVVIKDGDTLAKIAEEYFGSSAGWAVIWKQNQDVIKNPHAIYAGQTIAFYNFSQAAFSH